ncbi:hypothetical protein FE394_14080 [Xenorhabdus sp. Reich]|uniref:Uncharacterized protein n=1 Tax=Xenorhabdus littoralis TaxID=2582835 RepID=A0ABU4SNZ6_9GAMM|nr:hypothetical protein [Xenorhabdus sp. Reich]MDX8000294.1 hypothetical protein [Xenorhabdus sp. Reich]
MTIKNNVFKSNKNDYSVTTTIPDQSDIIAGQTSYINITITATNISLLKNIKKVTIVIDNTATSYASWRSSQGVNVGLRNASMEIQFSVNNEVAEKTNIPYTVHLWSDEKGTTAVANYTPTPITYTVKKIDLKNIITLNTDDNYIQPPEKDNPVSANNPHIIYSAKLTDIHGNILKGVQVVVASELQNQIYSDSSDKVLVKIGTQPDTGSPVPITTIRDNEIDYFLINTNESGEIKFGVYPQEYISARIDLKTGILSVTPFSYAASAYIFNAENPTNDPFGPSSPNIYNIDEKGRLQKTPDTDNMEVGIVTYDSHRSTDSLIFFIKGFEKNDKAIRLKPIYKISRKDSFYGYPFNFTYSQLPLDKSVQLYYLISPLGQDALYSMTSNLTYIGDPTGGNDNPDDNGVYIEVEVYSSYSPNSNEFDPNDQHNDRVYDNRLITIDMINQYIKTSIPITNTAPTGLYVVVKIAKNSTDQINGLPPIGSQCTLSIKIDSATRPAKKSYPSVTLSDAINHYHTFQIPYCDLTRVSSWDDGTPATISFIYSIEYAGVTQSSKKWKTTIGTANTAININEDGCPH